MSFDGKHPGFRWRFKKKSNQSIDCESCGTDLQILLVLEDHWFSRGIGHADCDLARDLSLRNGGFTMDLLPIQCPFFMVKTPWKQTQIMRNQRNLEWFFKKVRHGPERCLPFLASSGCPVLRAPPPNVPYRHRPMGEPLHLRTSWTWYKMIQHDYLDGSVSKQGTILDHVFFAPLKWSDFLGYCPLSTIFGQSIRYCCRVFPHRIPILKTQEWHSELIYCWRQFVSIHQE